MPAQELPVHLAAGMDRLAAQRPGLAEYRAGRRDRSITGSITFGSWARGRAFPQTEHFVAYVESRVVGVEETYAEWSLEHPQ